jgi:hypothetical protein
MRRQQSRKLFEGCGSLFLHLTADSCDSDHCIFSEATLVMKSSSLHIMNDLYTEGQLPSLTFALHSELQITAVQLLLGTDAVVGIRWVNYQDITGLQGKFFTFVLTDPDEASLCMQALQSLGVIQVEEATCTQYESKPSFSVSPASVPKAYPSLPQPVDKPKVPQTSRSSVHQTPSPQPISPPPPYSKPSRKVQSSSLPIKLEPLDLVRHLFTLDQVLYISYCTLYVHNKATDSNDFLQSQLILALVKDRPLQYSLNVIEGGQTHITTCLSDEFSFNADEAAHSISWIHWSSGAAYCYTAVVMEPIAQLATLLPRLVFEVFRGEAIADTDEAWFSSYVCEQAQTAPPLPTLNWGEAFEIEMEGSINHLTATSDRSSFSIVASDSLMSVYRTDIDELRCLNQIRVLDGRKLAVPSCLTLQPGDRLSTFATNDKLFLLDLDRGSIVRKWEGRTWTALTPDAHESSVIGATKGGIYLLDTRAKTDVSKKEYAGSQSFTCISGFSADGVAVGTAKGEIRLYKEVGQNSKTNFPHVGSKIKSIDISHDKAWVLATTKTFLLVVPATSKDLSGFRDRLGKHKQPPIRLSLTPQDVSRFGLTSVDFTPARFEKFEGEMEHSITTSTGSLLIIWNFASVKRGVVGDYTMKDMQSQVISAATQHSQPHIVVTMERYLRVQSRLQ